MQRGVLQGKLHVGKYQSSARDGADLVAHLGIAFPNEQDLAELALSEADPIDSLIIIRSTVVSALGQVAQ